MKEGRVNSFAKMSTEKAVGEEFKPKAKPRSPSENAIAAEVAEATGFTSRRPKAAEAETEAKPKRKVTRRLVREATVQFNMRVTESARDRFYQIVLDRGLTLGAAFEEAVSLLEAKFKGKK